MQNVNVGVGNILRVFSQATKGEIHAGTAWYKHASEETARRLPELPRKTAIGIVAALSPQTAWERNIRYAEKFVETGQCGQTGSNQAIAKAILEGAEPLEVLNKGFGYGYGKVSNFFKCLSDQDTDAVCIDGHAYAIWAGERITTNKTPNISKRLYQAIEEDYQSAASAVGLKPHQIQAITWLAWRRLHRVRQERDRDKGQMRFDFAS
jgi:hypothetical protein